MVVADCKSRQIIIKFVFSVALPTKKHLLDEQSESARRGESGKISDFDERRRHEEFEPASVFRDEFAPILLKIP